MFWNPEKKENKTWGAGHKKRDFSVLRQKSFTKIMPYKYAGTPRNSEKKWYKYRYEFRPNCQNNTMPGVPYPSGDMGPPEREKGGGYVHGFHFNQDSADTFVEICWPLLAHTWDPGLEALWSSWEYLALGWSGVWTPAKIPCRPCWYQTLQPEWPTPA